MNLNLNCEGFENHIVVRRPCNGGVKYEFVFQNGYGASVVKHSLSYGNHEDLWELAVLKKDEDDGEYRLDYDTEITDDVLGYLSDEEVCEILEKIKGL